MKELLLKYVRYNFRANSRVCNEFLVRLDEELWDKPIVSSFPSIRKTLYHIWGAEEKPPPSPPKGEGNIPIAIGRSE